jgi:UDP-N-acetylmuramate dehydrogenase
MYVQANKSLRKLNTFSIEAQAQFYTEIESVEALQEIISASEWKTVPKFILGGGSNILLIHDIPGLVIHNRIKGIKVIEENEDHIWLHVGGGEIWHEFVLHCVAHQLGGVENMSLIPGTVGAAPMQNIGAYGVEVKEVVESVEAMDLNSGKQEVFSNEACKFGYRDSIFKHDLKGKVFITGVVFKLNKKPVFRTEYGDILKTLTAMNVPVSIQNISDAVIQIRKSKLPDPLKIGNAGSFFKNPEIPLSAFESLKLKYPALPGYPTRVDIVKVPAGWLIEQAGWKGYREGEVGVHNRQALVLVNHANGTGIAIETLAHKIQQSVLEKFGIALSAEVNFI